MSTPTKPFLSLRLVISTLGVLLVLVVAVVTLTLTLTSSLSALRSVGRSQALLLLGAVEVKTQGLFEKEFRAIEAMDAARLTADDLRKGHPQLHTAVDVTRIDPVVEEDEAEGKDE